jgi:hypothetical protein
VKMRFTPWLGLFVLSQLVSTVSANDACDCNIFPFEPKPPCFKACYVGAASKASSASLQKVLGISETLAKKISNLDDVGTSFSSMAEIWQQKNLEGSQIQLATGENLGELVGYYRSPATNQIRFAVENTLANTLAGIPVEGTTASTNQVIMVQPHTPVYFAIDQPTAYGAKVNIKNIPLWTSNQLTKGELEILRKKMEIISPSDFNKLINN